LKRFRYAFLVVPVLVAGMAFPSSAAAQQGSEPSPQGSEASYNLPAQTECAPLFSDAGKLRRCVSAAARAAANLQLTALRTCVEVRFRGRPPRGRGRTSDLRKCQLAGLRTVNRILRTTG